MAKICLPLNQVENFKKALRKKDIKMQDLFNMSTEELHKTLEPYAGKDTSNVVLLFEQKRILKNSLLGMQNAVSKLAEVGRYSPERKAEIAKGIADFKEQQRERIFNPQEKQNFYNALADKILGTHVTEAEAKKVFELQSTADELKGKIEIGKTPKNDPIRTKAGAAEYLIKKYVEDLQTGNLDKARGSFTSILKDFGVETKQSFKEDVPIATKEFLLKAAKEISDLAVTLKASWDVSFVGRQGLNVLKTHPTVWWKMAKANVADFYKTMRKQDAEAALWADVYGRDNYLNGDYHTSKIIPKNEEPIPTRIHEKVPVIGRVFKASDVAFLDSAIRARMDTFDLLKNKAVRNGAKWDKVQTEDVGTLVNALTARGAFGRIGESPIIKLVFWAPRMLKAHWDVLTGHTFGSGLKTSFARKEAALNLVKVIGTDALIITLANALIPGSAETDPTSSNFGKIKVGNTSFDYTGGAGSLAVLGARMVTGTTKSPTTGVKYDLGSKFGQESRMDVITNFALGKTTPIIGQFTQMAKGRTYAGKKPTVGSVATGLAIPISVENVIQLKDDNSADAVLGVILDAFGINANTYPQSSTDWNLNITSEMTQFKKQVGSQKFTEANKLYNKKIGDWIIKVRKDPTYLKFTPKVQKAVIMAKRRRIKEEILRSYGFRAARIRRARTPRL